MLVSVPSFSNQVTCLKPPLWGTHCLLTPPPLPVCSFLCGMDFCGLLSLTQFPWGLLNYD